MVRIILALFVMMPLFSIITLKKKKNINREKMALQMSWDEWGRRICWSGYKESLNVVL